MNSVPVDWQRSYQQLADAIDALPEGFALFDADDRFVMWNRRYAEIYGPVVETIAVGTRFEDAVRAALAKGLILEAVGREEEWLAARLAQHQKASNTYEHRMRDDMWIRADERPTADGGRVSVRTDITELKRAEVKLREQNLRIDAAVDNMRQGLTMFDADGHLVLWNHQYIEMYGMSPDVVKDGCKLLELVEHRKQLGMFAGDPDAYCQSHHARIDEGKPWSRAVELTDGRSIQVVNRPMPGGGWVSTHEDITESKQAERMKTEFVAIVSHELRTPLTSIKGALGLMRSGAVGELPDKLKSMLDIAYSNSDRLIRLINDILDIEKIEAGKTDFQMAPLGLESLLAQAVDANKGYGEANSVSFSISSSLSEAKVTGDRDRLMQVLANLMSNAAKFSPDGDVIEISLSEHEENYRVSVKDHGPGIPQEFRDKIFGKFLQADSTNVRAQGGTGLGLNIAKAIVEEHGGSIGFETELGKGTTFFFDIPQLHEHRAAAISTSPKSVEPRVLVCENDPDIALLLEFMLTQDGFDVDISRSAGEAEERLDRNTYDAMTLDLGLDDKDGVTLIRELRENPKTKGLPIVVISARAKEGAKELNGDAIGIIDWLEKPIDRERLTESLRLAVPFSANDRARILHVEDDLDVLQIVSALVADIAEITSAETLAQAKALLEQQTFDLVVLDLMLPDGSGEDLLPLLNRQDGKPIPVVIFSVKDASKQTAEQVKSTLVKSMSSNETLLHTIHSAIASGRPQLQKSPVDQVEISG